MKIHGYFLDERLTEQEKQNLYDECRGCLNRICVTDDKTEVLTLLASLQTKAMILGKNTFLRIDEENSHWIENLWEENQMVYTVQMDLYIDDDEIYSDKDISNIIEESMSVASASVDHIKVIEVND